MTYTIEFTRTAQRELNRLPRRVQEQFERVIDNLSSEPRPHGVVKIRGATDYYRIRVGDYRAVYEVDDDARTIAILSVGHRGVIYRHFSLILLLLHQP